MHLFLIVSEDQYNVILWNIGNVYVKCTPQYQAIFLS